MSLALVGLATGLGARYPRFNAESPTDVAGSYGGVMFMIVAVLFVIVACVLVGWPSSLYLWHRARGVPLSAMQQWTVSLCFAAGAALSLLTWWWAMRSGVRALEEMG